MTNPKKKGCGLDPELMQHSFSVLVLTFPVVVMATALLGMSLNMLTHYNECIMRLKVYWNSNLPPSWS